LYGSETWCLTKEDIRKLEAMEMWIWRKSERITWTDHITNDEVLERVQEKRQLINLIKERQAKWIGHVMRSDTLLKDILEGRTKGKKQWQAKTENVRLDDGEGQWTHISRAEGDGTVSRNMEKMVSGTCPWAENLKKKKCFCP